MPHIDVGRGARHSPMFPKGECRDYHLFVTGVFCRHDVHNGYRGTKIV